MKRVLLFVGVNAGVLITISLVTRLFGLQPYLDGYGINYTSLMIFCLVWGMAGALISLAISRGVAKWTMGVKIIDPRTRDPDGAALVQTVHDLARRAGIEVMPEVGYYESDEVNAFATGPTKNRSLVAVSSGLLGRMRGDEVAGVLSHEVAHIANGDMVTMTLVQGVVNAFVMFFARVIAFAIGQMVRDDIRHVVHFAVVIALEIALSVLGMLVVAGYSRHREYRADAGGSELGGQRNMVAALKSLANNSRLVEAEAGGLATLKISSGNRQRFAMLFSTHPPLAERIRRLEGNR